jgi:copper chaperone
VITKKIRVQGIVGLSDADKVSHALNEVWGIRKVEVSAELGEATISYDEKAASLQDFQQAILDSGFEMRDDNGLGL